MADLFFTEPRQPLAEALRPKTPGEVIGQTHLLGPSKPLRLMVQARHKLDQFGKHTLLSVDGIHRFNKAVRSFFNQSLRKMIMQIFGLPHCFAGGKHG